LGGATRSYLAVLDAASGKALSFEPRLDGMVTALARYDSSVIVAGNFNALDGEPRAHLAALGLRTVLDTKFPPLDREGDAATIAGKTLYIGGSFTAAGGAPRGGLAAIDLESDALLPWAPAVAVPNASGLSVDGLAVIDSTVFVAGAFEQACGEARRSLAAVD